MLAKSECHRHFPGMATESISPPNASADDPPVTALANKAFQSAVAGDEDSALRYYAAALRRGVGRGVPAFMHLNILRTRGSHEIANRVERLALDYGADISFAGIQAEPDLSRSMAEYEALMAEGRVNARMVARYAQLASLAGDSDALTRMMDPAALLKVIRLEPMEPIPGNAPLADAVADYLMSDSVTMTWHDAFRSTRQINHLPHVDRLDVSPLRELFMAIRAEIDTYLQSLDALDHPFFRWRPAAPAFGAWALHSSGAGYNIPHIHPQGWLTGVYYAAWRPPEGADLVADEGALHIGPDLQGDSECSGWPRAAIAPEAGTLVIMPSYYMHHTLPARPGSLRIAIPFDVVDQRSFVTDAALKG